MKFPQILFFLFFCFSVQIYSQEAPIQSEKYMVFPGCEGDNVQLKKCFLKKVQLHIAKNFDADLPNQLGLEPGKKRGFVMFTITEDGSVSSIKVRANHPELAEECKRSLSNLPTVIPKKVNGIAQESEFTTPFYVYVKKPDTILKNLVLGDKEPIYNGCHGNKAELKKCFSLSIQKFLKDNFKKNNNLGLDIGNYDITLNFMISKDGSAKFGNILNNSIKNLNESVSADFKRIIDVLPKFTPAKRKGKPVNIMCSIPFKFDVTKELPVTTISNKKVVSSFFIIEDVPIYPGCRGNKRELKSCFSKKVQQHFVRKFDSDLVNRLNLVPGKKKVFIFFVINIDGTVSGINVRAPHQKIKDEVIRVMKVLPRFIPGKQSGKPVNVKYSIPLTIIVEDNHPKKDLDPFKNLRSKRTSW